MRGSERTGARAKTVPIDLKEALLAWSASARPAQVLSVDRTIPKAQAGLMKSRVALAITLCCIIAGISAASFWQYGFSEVTHGFTLTVTGQAYDALHKKVNVTLSFRGTENERWTKVIQLRVESGDLNVVGYETFPVSKGEGILVQRYHFIFLNIKISPQYGGQSISWHLLGRTGNLAGKILPVSLFASQVFLPPALQGLPRLTNLFLNGTITLD